MVAPGLWIQIALLSDHGNPTSNLKMPTSYTVVWAQLLGLSAEYYDTTSVQRIGNSIRSLLHVDAYTAHHTCGQYACVC